MTGPITAWVTQIQLQWDLIHSDVDLPPTPDPLRQRFPDPIEPPGPSILIQPRDPAPPGPLINISAPEPGPLGPLVNVPAPGPLGPLINVPAPAPVGPLVNVPAPAPQGPFINVPAPAGTIIDASAKDILEPSGEPIGKPGKSPRVRVVDEQELDQTWAELEQEYGPARETQTPKGKIKYVETPGGGRIQIRDFSGSGGKTIDIKGVEGVRFKKLHIG